MKYADFSIRVISDNPHARGSDRWRAGQIVAAMEGCSVDSIICALYAFERDTRDIGVVDPKRWIILFAGFVDGTAAWIDIIRSGNKIGRGEYGRYVADIEIGKSK
jgi:hypothetical protein